MIFSPNTLTFKRYMRCHVWPFHPKRGGGGSDLAGGSGQMLLLSPCSLATLVTIPSGGGEALRCRLLAWIGVFRIGLGWNMKMQVAEIPLPSSDSSIVDGSAKRPSVGLITVH